MSTSNHPWESPWIRHRLCALLILCAGCAGWCTATKAASAETSSQGSQGSQGTTLDRYRRLVPYMTYYVAQGLAQRPLQPVHNALEPFNPPGRLRGGAANGYVVPTYAVRPSGPSASTSSAAAQRPPPGSVSPPRTLFRFDFQQSPRPAKVREQPFLPSPPLTPENKDSDDYFKPVTDTANYYRGVSASAATPAPNQDPHLVVFPEDDLRLRAKLRQQQRKQQQQQLLLQQHQNQQLLDDAFRLKLLMLQQQQQQQQQAKELRAQLQVQRLRDQLRAQQQQEHDVRVLVQAQQAKRYREQQLRVQQDQEFQAQLQAHRDQHLAQLQEAHDQKSLRDQQLAQLQEAHDQKSLRDQQLAQLQEAHDQKSLRDQQLAQLQEAHDQKVMRDQQLAQLRAHELKKLRAQQIRQQQDQELQAQLKQDEELRVHIEQQRLHQHHKAHASVPPSGAADAAPNETDTEVEQQVVVSLEDVEKALPPSAPGSAASPVEVVVEPRRPTAATPIPTDIKPVVYAEEAEVRPVNPTSQNVAHPSSSREIVAHLINGLQLSNKLPQTLTPDNFDMSLKTILQLLKVLHNSKATNGAIATPAKIKVSPEAPERDTSFYIGGGTVSQTFPAPSVEGSTPGRPGIDYPAYDSIPQTSFSCATQRYKGFFGDPDTNCQVWHYCDLNGGQASFLCPNGTIFSQVGLTCDWWFNVRCASTAQLYVLNERLYKYILPVKPSFPEDYSGPDVDRYLTEKFREMQAKARGRKEKEKAKQKDNVTTSNTAEHPEEPVETNQTEDNDAGTDKAPEASKEKGVEEKQELDPDL